MNEKHYLDKQGLSHLIDKLNERNRTRFKYKGELALNADTRTDWQDLIPAAVGDLYVLTGEEGEMVTINDADYEVGDTIYVINRVEEGETDDVIVNKISASGKAIIYTDAELGLPDPEDKSTYAKFYLVKPDELPTSYTSYNFVDCHPYSDGKKAGILIDAAATVEEGFKTWNEVFSGTADPVYGDLMQYLEADGAEVHCFKDAENNWHGLTDDMVNTSNKLYYNDKDEWVEVGKDAIRIVDSYADLPDPENSQNALWLVPDEREVVVYFNIKSTSVGDFVDSKAYHAGATYGETSVPYEWETIFGDSPSEYAVAMFAEHAETVSYKWYGTYCVYKSKGKYYCCPVNNYTESVCPGLYYAYNGEWLSYEYELVGHSIDAERNDIYGLKANNFAKLPKLDALSLFISGEYGWEHGFATREFIHKSTIASQFKFKTPENRLYLKDYDKDDANFATLIANIKFNLASDTFPEVPFDEKNICVCHKYWVENEGEVDEAEYLEFILPLTFKKGILNLTDGTFEFTFIDPEPLTDEDITSLDMIDVDITTEGGIDIWSIM